VREKRMTFEAVAPVKLQLTLDETGQQLRLEAMADEALIVPASLQARIWLEDETGQREGVSLDGSDGRYRGEIDLMAFSGPRGVVIEAQAKTLNGAPIGYSESPAEVEGLAAPPPPPEPAAPEPMPASEPPPPPPEPVPVAEPEESGWMGAALWFGMINLLALAAAGALYWWLRRRRQRNRVQLVDEDEVETEALSEKTEALEAEEKPS
jgi:hypothetical protein